MTKNIFANNFKKVFYISLIAILVVSGFLVANSAQANPVTDDSTAPVITLLGANLVNLTVGDSYTDAGATALDDIDGDITANIVVVNPVNTSAVGTYTVTYNVSDGSGNKADEVTRIVIVSAAPVVTPPPSGGGGGGRGGGYIRPTPTPQILGIATFNFTVDLRFGMTGNDVTELQKRLTAEGVYSGPITGYFGQLTFAGVKAYQKKYGISQTGIVDSLTRAQLNASQVAGVSTVNIEAIRAQVASLQAQIIALLQQLIPMLQAQVNQLK